MLSFSFPQCFGDSIKVYAIFVELCMDPVFERFHSQQGTFLVRGESRKSWTLAAGVHSVDNVPLLFRRFNPWQTISSILFTLTFIRLALETFKSCDDIPVASTSSIIQYQLHIVSEVTGATFPWRSWKCCNVPQPCSIRASRITFPVEYSTLSSVYRL